MPRFCLPSPPEEPLSRARVRTTARQARAVDAKGVRLPEALDFATWDYLDLASHPALRPAAGDRFTPHQADTVQMLENRIARFLALTAAATFPKGEAAIRTTLGALLTPQDSVIVDAGCHRAMFETVLTAHAQLLRCPPGSVDAVERRLCRLSRAPGIGQIYIAVPAIAELTSTMADLAGLAALASFYGARLVVDVSHDLGALGPQGRGVMEVQGCLGRPDIVLGGLDLSFGASGGFAAFRDPTLKDLLRPALALSAPLSPSNAAMLLAGFDIIDSAEGGRRRHRLHGSALRLRNHLSADGLGVMGHPSGLVPVLLPPGTAEACASLLASAGPVVPLLRAPVVAGHAPRWCIRLRARHGPADIDDLAELLREVTRTTGRSIRSPQRATALQQP